MQWIAWRAASLLSLLALCLSGCVSPMMSQAECVAGDWYSAGLEDGIAGRVETAFDRRVAQCAQFEAPPADGAVYNEGRDFGLRRFCTETGGEQFGRDGGRYRGVCREDTEEAFLRGYLPGRRIYGYQQDVAGANSTLSVARITLSNLRRTIRESRRTLKDEEATEEEKEEAQKDLDNALERLPYAKEEFEIKTYLLDRAYIRLRDAIEGDQAWRQSSAFNTALIVISAAHQVARREPAVHSCTEDVSLLSVSCRVSEGMAVTDDATGQICAVGPGDIEMVRRARDRFGEAPEYIVPFEFYRKSPDSLREAFFGREADGEFDALLRDGRVIQVMCPFGVFPPEE